MNNERLIVLANECTSYKEGFIEGKHDIEIFDKEKFAELIVRECMVLCKSIDETDTRYRYDYRRGVLDCVDTIKEHFGVKE